jgi:uncharacterized OB-fold protein
MFKKIKKILGYIICLLWGHDLEKAKSIFLKWEWDKESGKELPIYGIKCPRCGRWC